MADQDLLPPGHFFAGLPRAAFPVIYADPPWHFVTHSEKGQGRSPSQHYATRPFKEILTDPVADLAAEHCHLFLWCTAPMVAAGMHVEVMNAWGFKPSSLAFVWIKTNDQDTCARATTWDDVLWAGGGFTTRQNAEVIMLGRRGSPKRAATDVRQIIVAPRREHSRKPAEARRRVERYAGRPGIELYARETAEGWTSWGNQVGKFDDVA